MEVLIQAHEDLQTLETQHPNRFEYLKLELKSFIFLLQTQQSFPPQSPFSSHLVSTQGSSSEKRKKYSCCGTEGEEKRESKRKKIPNVEEDGLKMKKDRVEVVLERAQSCLRKIQVLKATLRFVRK